MNSQSVVEWQLGDWLGLPPWLGWILLFALAVICVSLAVWFYRDTLRSLTSRQRTLFVALRSGFFILLLLCLASPARVERTYDSNQDSRPLAVVVDRSDSMTTADGSGATRLSNSLRIWKGLETNAVRSFPSLRYFRFSQSLSAAPDLESAILHDEAGRETHLYQALSEAMKNPPPGGYGGICCLTDGLDTTQDTTNSLIADAARNHTPLYFIAGVNHEAKRETLLAREIDVPGQVLRKSQFTATVLIESHTTQARDVPLSLLRENVPLSETTLHLHPGYNLTSWTVPVNSDEPGLIHLGCRLGTGADEQLTSAAVRVVAQEQNSILFYQGTLDWSYRFIHAALQGDPSFVFTGIYNPDLQMTHLLAPSPTGTLTAMPDHATDLDPYRIVVLSNVSADRMSVPQQEALIQYVKGGGGLLLLVSDSSMARTFSGTKLEQMLPVIFESPQAHPADDSLNQFQQMMHSVGGGDPTREGEFQAKAVLDSGLEPLEAFAFPATGKRSDIAELFGAASGALLHDLPKFATFAHIHGIKAGSEILAVQHGTTAPNDDPSRALLVSQRFGEGHVTALLTDGLWRWKLSLPSASHDPGIFWQQLFLALAGGKSERGGVRFSAQPYFAALEQSSHFQVEGVQGKGTPLITVTSPRGASQTLSPQLDVASNGWNFDFKPTEPGNWRIHAEDGRGASQETLLRVSTIPRSQELSGLPPDMDGLRQLAEATGGSLLNDGAPASWSTSDTSHLATLVARHSRPLWDSWIILLLALGFYVTELIWRRQAKLL